MKADQSYLNRCRGRLAAAVALTTLAVTGVDTAFAQEVDVEGTFNVQRFNTAPGPRNFLVTRGARSDGEHAFSFGAMVHYGHKPFVINSLDQGGRSTEVLAVEVLGTADVLFAYTPISQLQFGLRLPVTYAKGQGLTERGTAGQLEGNPVDAFGLSDPELEAKFRFLGQVDSPFAMAVSAFATAPLGEATAEGAHIGHESVTGGARLIMDLRQGPLSTAANVGYRFQPEGRIENSVVGNEALFGIGLGYEASPVFHLIGDLFGTSGLSGEAGTNTLELAVGARITPLSSPIAVTFGGGPGLIHAVGGPVMRAFIGFSYANEAQDLDMDGIDDTVDQCPADAEDFDGFEDSDGCPDPDNDGDGILDGVDKCPDRAEDIDQFEDADGCPDDDNDKDGLPDVQDRCPNEPETINGFEDEDGCPDVADSDSDGVEDSKDQCPNEPEDTDGFQDEDGCPDPDNDGDGIPDERDECIDEPEDIDGFEDEDGCPEENDTPSKPRAPVRKPPASSSPRLGSEDNPIEL